MSDDGASSGESDGPVATTPAPPDFNPGLHIALLVVGLAPAAVLAFIASFTICGISGCSGGGFGRATDPRATLTLLVCAGLVAAAPLALYALWLRRLSTALVATAVAIAVSIGSGLLIGSDFQGCPRSVDPSTCLDEASSWR